jgi:hypothetical protein
MPRPLAILLIAALGGVLGLAVFPLLPDSLQWWIFGVQSKVWDAVSFIRG